MCWRRSAQRAPPPPQQTPRLFECLASAPPPPKLPYAPPPPLPTSLQAPPRLFERVAGGVDVAAVEGDVPEAVLVLRGGGAGSASQSCCRAGSASPSCCRAGSASPSCCRAVRLLRLQAACPEQPFSGANKAMHASNGSCPCIKIVLYIRIYWFYIHFSIYVARRRHEGAFRLRKPPPCARERRTGGASRGAEAGGQRGGGRQPHCSCASPPCSCVDSLRLRVMSPRLYVSVPGT